MSWQIAVGAKVSSTSTSAVQEFVFPLVSVTVSVTIFRPILLQSKLVISIVAPWIPQASVLPPSSIAAVIFATPEEFSATVMFWHIASGAIMSSTVTTATQLVMFPAASITLSVTLFGPISLHVKVSISIVIFGVSQSTTVPPLISEGVILAIPIASNAMVMS